MLQGKWLTAFFGFMLAIAASNYALAQATIKVAYTDPPPLSIDAAVLAPPDSTQVAVTPPDATQVVEPQIDAQLAVDVVVTVAWSCWSRSAVASRSSGPADLTRLRPG